MSEFIDELGLVADQRAIRTTPAWRPPSKILVTGGTPDMLAWLQPAAPNVALVSIRGEDDGLLEVVDADAIIGWYSEEMVAKGPRLSWLQVHTAGVERALASSDIAARGIVVTNLKRIAAPAIAEHVFAMLLFLTRRLGSFRESQQRRRWTQFEVPEKDLVTLRGRNLVIAGLGGIGTEVARLGHAFGMRVDAVRANGTGAPDFVRKVSPPSELSTAIAAADVVVNALPLTNETTRIFDSTMFASLKREAIFVNVARGGSVDTEALLRSLRDGRLAGAALDVTDPEPLPSGHPLWRMHNVLITPHVAGLGCASHDRSWLLIRENLRRFVAGEEMLSVVHPERGY